MRSRSLVLNYLLVFLLSAGGLKANESLSDLRAKAERGDSAARYAFAQRVFERGEGKNTDREAAFPWLEAAAKQGHVPSLELAATMRLIDESDHADFARGLELVRQAETVAPASVRIKALRGLMHHQGRGRDFNPELGLALIAEAAEAGDLVALEMQRQIKAGKGLSDVLAYAAPPPSLLRAAENGDAGALWQIAQLYFAGHIVHDEKRNPGFGWRERAAESGSAAAQAALGEALRSGMGYPKDATRALRWLTRAAAQNHPHAAYLAGLMHRDGEGTAKNEKEAARLLGLAVEHGSKDAETSFGILLVEGRGLAADPQRGYTLLNRAEKRNNTVARTYLLEQAFAGKYGAQDEQQALRLLEHGVRLKQTRAKTALGARLFRGEGVKQDLGRASQLLREASEEGDVNASRGYLELLTQELNRLEERRKTAGAVLDSEIARRFAEYQDALVLYARNGGRDQKLEAAKILSDNWLGPKTKKFQERHGTTIDNVLQKAVALVRLYRGQGGKDAAALRWLKEMEQHYRDLKWKNVNGETAQVLFERAEKELREFKRP